MSHLETGAFAPIESYLAIEEVRSIERWVEPLLPLLEQYPTFGQTDLVIEGGIGRGQTMPHIMRRLFPQALYIGTDLARDMFNRDRQIGNISEETLNRVISANQHPSVAMDGAIIRANCFDGKLVADILTKTEQDTQC